MSYREQAGRQPGRNPREQHSFGHRPELLEGEACPNCKHVHIQPHMTCIENERFCKQLLRLQEQEEARRQETPTND